ncbi:MAG: NADH-quinone oxidoreductase subunit N [Dehalococcoidia bacterium]|nr:NADH-quinone oxidoreductase subunit N [Dehalococcoidia bacterium]MQG15798.1 NADH-quinone oxidoreductase subunit N [SAR202 cluster bacterium]
MSLHDIYLLSPEISLAGLALVIVLLDVFIKNRILVQSTLALGLVVPIVFSVLLWNGVGISDNLNSNNQLFGIFDTLVVDKFTLLFKFLFLGILAIVMISSITYSHRFEKTKIEYFSLLIFATVGMMLLASTRELITIYISLELTALPMAVLIAISGNKLSSEAGIKFLILSAVSSALLLYGMVWVYGLTGTTDVAEIFNSIQGINIENVSGSETAFGNYGLLLGVILIVAGFGFKISSVPFHMWVPDVYEGAPTPITAFLSVASKAAGFAVILRVFFGSFSTESISIEWSMIFAIMAVLSMGIGNFVAIAQKKMKRLLAYSTIAHAGYMMMGLTVVSSRMDDFTFDGPAGVVFYLIGYAATNLAAFVALIAISNKTGSDSIEDLSGLGRRAPVLAFCLAIALVSLTGIPPTVGFMAKLNVFTSAFNGGLWWLVLAGTVSSVISAYYYLRIIKVMYLSDPLENVPIKPDRLTSIALTVTVLAVVVFGLYPTPVIRAARVAVEFLLV